MKTTFTKVHETEEAATFFELTEYRSGETFEMNHTYYKTREAASKAGAEAREAWGSNLVFLGSSPKEINGETFFENGFNVWN